MTNNMNHRDKILKEMEMKRDRYTKHFQMEKKGGVAVMYPTPVHYEEDGQWKDIDNRLEAKEEDGRVFYKNRASSVNVRFAKNPLDGELVTMKKGNHTVSWSLELLENKVQEEENLTETVQSAYVLPEENPAGSQQSQELQNEDSSYTGPKDFYIKSKELVEENTAAVAETVLTEDSVATDATETETSEEEVTIVADKAVTTTDETEAELPEAEETVSENETAAEQPEEEFSAAWEVMKEKAALPNLNTAGVYEDIKEGMDISYQLLGERLKENIVLKTKAAAKKPIKFAIQHKGLEMKPISGGSIGLYDGEDLIFEFVRPYMYDAAGEFCYDVVLQAEIGEGESSLRLIQDEEWLLSDERVYPVVVDPMTETSKDVKNILDTFVSENSQGVVNGNGSFVIGKNSSYGISRALLKFKELPAIEKGSIIYAANMVIWQYAFSTYGTAEIPIMAHKMNQSWNASSVTWTEAQNHDATVLDYKKMKEVVSDSQLKITPLSFDITKVVRQWYNNSGENHGILLRSNLEYSTAQADQAYGRFFASDYPADGYYNISEDQYPCGMIYYRNVSGLESYQNYHEQPLGRAGCGYTNDYTGNIVWIHPDAKTSGGILPAGLNHVYNLSSCDTDLLSGYGWRLSAMQELKDSGLEDYPYVYIDGDGTKHYFYRNPDQNMEGVPANETQFIDEDGLGLTITKTSSDVYDAYRTMTTKDKITYTFGADGYLRKIEDVDGNAQTYSYAAASSEGVSNRLISIKDATNAVLTLAYNTAGTRLVSVTDEIGRVTSFTYDTAGNLQAVIYPDGKQSKFAYDTSHQLYAIRNTDNRKIMYEFVDDYGVKRVSRITQIGDDSALGGAVGEFGYELAISYENGNTTVFTEPGLDGDVDTDSDNRKIYYHFDNMGRPFDVIHDDGSANSYQFYSEGQQNNRLSRSGFTQKTVYSLLKNPCLDMSQSYLGFDSWELYKSADTTYYYGLNRHEAQSIDNGPLYKELGLGYLSVASGLTTNRNGFQQTVTLNAGTYTFSAYVSFVSCTARNSGDSGASLEILDASENVLAKSRIMTKVSDTNVNGGWDRLSVTFTLDSQTEIRTVGVLEGINGTAYFTGMQLETGDAPNKLNLLNNPGFRKIENGAPIGWTYNTTDTNNRYVVDPEKAASAKLVGETDKEKSIYQIVNIKGQEGDVYCLSGWAKGAGIPGQKFMLAAKVTYEDNSEKWFELPFSPNITDEWQFVSGTFRTDDTNGDTKKKYSSITVMLIFHNQANEVLFNGIQLTRDDGASYVYDSNGDLVSAKSAAESSKFVQDGSSNLTKMGDIRGTSFEYVYDDKKHVKSAKNSQGLRYQFGYNTEGNPESTVVQGGRSIQAVTPGRTYYIREKVSGNYLHVKDEGTTTGTSVVLGTFNGRDAHKWKVVENPDGQYLLVPKHAEDLCLQVKDASTADYAAVVVCTKDGSDAQHWKFHPVEEGFCQISCKAMDNKKGLSNRGSSTTNGHGVQNCTLAETYENQKWCFEPVEAEDETYSDVPEAGKIFSIRVRHSGQYIGAAEKDSNNLEYGKSQCFNGSSRQQFYLEAASEEGYYYLRPVYTIEEGVNRTLMVGNQDADGHNMVYVASKSTGHRGQMFRFEPYSEGSAYRIICKYNDLVLNVKNMAYENGAPLILSGYSAGAGNNQLWILEKLSDRITSSMTYTASRKHVASVTDSRGNVSTNTYDANDRLLLSSQDAEGNVTSYTYDSNDRLLTVTGNTGSQNISIAYGYTDDKLSKITHNGFDYTFAYDVFGNRTSTSVAGQELMRTEYRPHNGLVEKSVYGNGCEIRNVYDKNERLIAQYKKEPGSTSEVKLFENTYDSCGNLTCHVDLENNTTTEYKYDMIGRITGSYSRNNTTQDAYGITQAVSFDEKNRVSQHVQKLVSDTASVSTGYIYGDPENGEEPGLIYAVTVNSVEKIRYTYDDLGRVVKKTLNPGTTAERVTEYTYVSGAKAGTTTLLVETVTENGITWNYTYDKIGNITKIRKINSAGTVTEEARYVYDGLGQLVREDNPVTDKTETYTYDAGGNITARKAYQYTSGTVSAAVDTKNYLYSGSLSSSQNGIHAGWRDLLIGYGDESDDYFRYDNSGNVLSYRGRTFTWTKGRNLRSISDGNGLDVSFLYDQNGNRILKTTETRTVKYHVDGGRILAAEDNGNKLHFLYDQDGTVFAVRYMPSGQTASTYYYYLHNLLGDVTGLVDSNGTQVVSYEYDSWGKLVNMVDDSTHGIGTKNPFRYRGYCYDDETGYYYLKSRYYDPEVGRFVNADDIEVIEVEPAHMLQYNLYTYCHNNPINLRDEFGNWPEWADTVAKVVSGVAVLAGIVAVAVASAPAAVIVAGIFLGTACASVVGGIFNELNGGTYTSGCIGGAISGLTQGVMGKLMGTAGVVLGGSLGSGIGTMATEWLENEYGNREEKMPHSVIVQNALTSATVALGTSTLTGIVSAGVDIANKTGAYGLIKNYSENFGSAITSFFGAVDDACTYIILRERFGSNSIRRKRRLRRIKRKRRRRWKKY